MATHLSIELIRRFEGRKASRAEIDEVCEHLWDCDTCHQAYLTVLERRFPVEIDFDELAGLKGWHLEGEELTAYLAGQMDELDYNYAALHLEECPKCRYEVGRASRASLKQSAGGGPRPISPGEILPTVLSSLRSVASPRFQVSGLAILILASLILVWALWRPKHIENPDLGGLSAQDTGPSNVTKPELQPASPPSAPGGGIRTGDSSNPSKRKVGVVASQSPSERTQKEIELAMVQGNLMMPPIIKMFDTSQAELIRGNASSKESFSIIGPFNTIVADDRPMFRWTPFSGATSYTVSVYDANLHVVRASGPLNGTQWVTPERLRRGTTYTWIVTAKKGGTEIVAPTLPARAEFRLASSRDLEKLHQDVDAAASHTARGVIYAKAGLLDEAEREFETVIKLRPPDERAKKLLKTVKSWRSGEVYLPPSPTTTKPAQ